MSKRTKITQDPITGNVTLTYWDPWKGHSVTNTYWASSGFGYIRIVNPDDKNMRQVCEMLYEGGIALMASKDTLLDVIRKEWRKRRRYEKLEGWW